MEIGDLSKDELIGLFGCLLRKYLEAVDRSDLIIEIERGVLSDKPEYILPDIPSLRRLGLL